MHIPRLAYFALVLTTALAACGGQTGEVAPDFCDGPRTWLGRDATSLTGFSADEVLGAIPATTTASLAWDNGDTTTLTLSVAFDDVIQNDGMVAAIDAQGESCSPRLEVPVSIAFETADGLLGETLIGYLLAETPESARLQADLYAQSLMGSLDASTHVPGESWDPSSAKLFFDLRVGEDASGTITLDTHREDGEQSNAVLASW